MEFTKIAIGDAAVSPQISEKCHFVWWLKIGCLVEDGECLLGHFHCCRRVSDIVAHKNMSEIKLHVCLFSCDVT